jgi:hypothetical protein
MIPTRLDSKTLISPPASQVSGQEGASVDGRREPAGALIINADDWGRDRETTQRIFACFLHGTVSSTSAMVFMEDSERAAEIALEQSIDAGLHFNFTTPFSGRNCPRSLRERQRELTVYLRRRRLARLFFHPGLARSFEYVVKAQLEAFYGLYGVEPKRVDGHHHMHLCANVLLGKLLPVGTFARRSFSRCRPSEGLGRSIYRHLTDRITARRHCLTDFFFSLMPFEPAGHLEHVFTLARSFTVEVETHPINPEEYRFLTGPDIFRRLKDVPIASGFLADRRDQHHLYDALAQARGN